MEIVMASLPAIGYVTSGAYDGSFKTQFLAGLASPAGGGWQGNPAQPNPTVLIKVREADGDYDAKGVKQTLKRYIENLNADKDVRLIVAVGGLVTAFAAVKFATKPYLVLVGQIPTSDDFDLDPEAEPNFCGGINLATTATNDQRNAKMVGLTGCRPDEVCLVFNENARMAKSERRAWKAHGWPALAGGRDYDGDNDDEDFVRVFRKAKKKKYKAIVLSADPFFSLRRDELVKAANTVGGTTAPFAMRFCYPSQYYATPAPVPTPGRDVWFGPSLDEAYLKIGVKAGHLLGKIETTGVEFVGLDTLISGEGNIP
jgi:hypothetical protein